MTPDFNLDQTSRLSPFFSPFQDRQELMQIKTSRQRSLLNTMSYGGIVTRKAGRARNVCLVNAKIRPISQPRL